MSADTPDALPPLPHPVLLTVGGVYNADQMRAYALAATAALRARLEAAERERDAAYLEMRRQWPAVIAVFDRDVWTAAMKEPPR